MRGKHLAADIPAGVLSALSDDLNTPLAIAELHRLASLGDVPALLGGLQVMGIETVSSEVRAEIREGEADVVERLLAERHRARAEKDFVRADALREAIADAGVVIIDTPQGTEWRPGPGYDPSKLEALNDRRKPTS